MLCSVKNALLNKTVQAEYFVSSHVIHVPREHRVAVMHPVEWDDLVEAIDFDDGHVYVFWTVMVPDAIQMVISQKSAKILKPHVTRQSVCSDEILRYDQWQHTNVCIKDDVMI